MKTMIALMVALLGFTASLAWSGEAGPQAGTELQA